MKQRSAHVVNEHQSSSNKEGDCKLAAHRLGVCMRRGPLRLALGASCGAQLTATPAARAHHHRRRPRSAARSAASPGPRRCRWPGRRARARQSAAARPHAAPPALATQTEPSLWLTHPALTLVPKRRSPDAWLRLRLQSCAAATASAQGGAARSRARLAAAHLVLHGRLTSARM